MSTAFECVSAFSISRLLDVPEGVLDPVREGEFRGVSFNEDGTDVGESTNVFSVPVIVSEMARKPNRFCLTLVLPDMGGRGEEVPLASLSGRGEEVGRPELRLPSRFVTVGEIALARKLPAAVLALADRNRPLKPLL